MRLLSVVRRVARKVDRYYVVGASVVLAGATYTQSRVHAAAPTVDYAAVEKVKVKVM